MAQRFIEYFDAYFGNPNTRQAYFLAVLELSVLLRSFTNQRAESS